MVGGKEGGGGLARGDEYGVGFERFHVAGVNFYDGQVVACDYEEELFVESSVDDS